MYQVIDTLRNRVVSEASVEIETAVCTLIFDSDDAATSYSDDLALVALDDGNVRFLDDHELHAAAVLEAELAVAGT